MTIEEAKIILINRGFVEVNGYQMFDGDKWRNAIAVISKWLEQQTCEDCISRRAVIDMMNYGILEDNIKALPSVTPKEKIIHCKDCKYRDYWGDCTKWSKELDAHKSYILDENMFCGFAERKASE